MFMEGSMREDHYVLFRREDGYWYYYVYRFGKKVRRSTGEKRKGRAQAVVEARLAAGDILGDREKARIVTFAEFAEPFWDYDRCPIIQDKIRRGGHFSHDFALNRRMCVQKYMAKPFGSKVLLELTPAMINRWLLSLPERFKVTPQTANKQLSTLQQMLDVAVAEGLISQNPARSVKPLVPKASFRGCFTPEQIKALFSERWPDWIAELGCRLSALTGMRLGEVRGLQRDQIHEDYILVDRSYNNIEKIKTTKSGKPRVIPIPRRLSQELLSVPNNGPFVISYEGDLPLHNSTLTARLRARMEAVEIDWKTQGLSFHSFRHFFNTRLVAAGVQGEKIRAVIGHESEDMTEHYAHLSADDLKQIRIIQEAI